MAINPKLLAQPTFANYGIAGTSALFVAVLHTRPKKAERLSHLPSQPGTMIIVGRSPFTPVADGLPGLLARIQEFIAVCEK
jgi:hypothetical protein